MLEGDEEIRSVFHAAAELVAEARLLEKTNELATFTRYLQLLHRLSTTNYAQIDDLFTDYLITGCEIFGVTHGVITQAHPKRPTVRAVHGAVAGSIEDPNAQLVITERRTFSCSSSPQEACANAFYIGTPILIDDRVYGAIGFWSDEETAARELHPQAREIIEMMAKSIGVAVHQRALTDQLAYQANHDALTGLPNRLLLT